MDDRRFDQLARSLAEGRSRRHVLKGLAGGAMTIALAALRPDHGLAAPKVRVCHLTGSASNPVELITVSVHAIPDHEAHGDVIAPDFANDPNNCGGCLISCDDGNPCTIDACVGGGCINTPVVCDPPAACQGPGACNPDTGHCDYPFQPADVVCRPPAGPCDIAETCTGNSATCPLDAFQPNTVQCRAGDCTNGVATLPVTCPGTGPDCPVAQTQNCGPFACGPTTCHTTCTDDTQCSAGHHCDDGQCLPDEGLGTACDEDGDCQSGFCVGGICCNERCAGECVQCTAATNGVCTPAANETACGPSGGQVCCDGICCAVGESCDGTTCQVACLELQTACDPANDRCCQGAVCLGGQCRDFCTVGGESCGGDDECCSGACSVPPDCAFGFDVRCCREAGEDCTFGCECCSGLACSPEEVCCAPAGAICESAIECCGNACENGRCCGSESRACADTSECCEGFLCRDGLCRPEACLDLQEACVFDADCCGDSSVCRVACGVSITCCSATGGPCAENCDCCGDDQCVDNTCQAVCPEGRLEAGFVCDSVDECCPGLECAQAYTDDLAVDPLRCCLATQSPCSFHSRECCSPPTGPAPGQRVDAICHEGTCCVPPGFECLSTGDCCGAGQCTVNPREYCRGVDDTNTCCQPLGAPCDIRTVGDCECCSGFCDNGICVAGACFPNGVLCPDNDFCCSGRCVEGRCESFFDQ